MSIAIIANPNAGRGRANKVAKQVVEVFQNKQVDFQIHFTRYAKQAIDLAHQASQRHKTIVALGGDGTVNEVLMGMMDSKSKLAIIPGGTGNDYARGLNIPKDANQAAKIILQDYSVKMDVVKEHTRAFGVVSTLGFPSTVLEYVNNHRDSLIKGSLVFAGAIIKTLHNLTSHEVGIVIDGKPRNLSTVGIILMNMPYGGGGLMFAPKARYDDGYISLVIIKDVGAFELLKTLPLVYFGKHINHPAVEIIPCRQVSITSSIRLAKSFDGDLDGFTPLEAVIVPQAVSVIIDEKKRTL